MLNNACSELLSCSRLSALSLQLQLLRYLGRWGMMLIPNRLPRFEPGRGNADEVIIDYVSLLSKGLLFQLRTFSDRRVQSIRPYHRTLTLILGQRQCYPQVAKDVCYLSKSSSSYGRVGTKSRSVAGVGLTISES